MVSVNVKKNLSQCKFMGGRVGMRSVVNIYQFPLVWKLLQGGEWRGYTFHGRDVGIISNHTMIWLIFDVL